MTFIVIFLLPSYRHASGMIVPQSPTRPSANHPLGEKPIAPHRFPPRVQGHHRLAAHLRDPPAALTRAGNKTPPARHRGSEMPCPGARTELRSNVSADPTVAPRPVNHGMPCSHRLSPHPAMRDGDILRRSPAACPSGLRERIANPRFVGSNPTAALPAVNSFESVMETRGCAGRPGQPSRGRAVKHPSASPRRGRTARVRGDRG